MQSKNKICFIMLGLVGQLFFFGYVAPELLKAGDNPSKTAKMGLVCGSNQVFSGKVSNCSAGRRVSG
jgi:hypothetical protein